ncbi:MAG TPA: hypothetical protein ENH57_01000, partial [Actinobacteria bacterium]|nr:hypothetical protein [Actinomycetota bacterium]
MNNTEIIQALKDNEWLAYGGWSLEMRTEAHRIGVLEFECRTITSAIEWYRITAITHPFRGEFTYRL